MPLAGLDLGLSLISFDLGNIIFYIKPCAGVVKLVDARDSKSREPKAHVGSIPTSGTINSNKLTAPAFRPWKALFVLIVNKVCPLVTVSLCAWSLNTGESSASFGSD